VLNDELPLKTVQADFAVGPSGIDRVKVTLINDTVYRIKVGAKRSTGTPTRGDEMIHA
jgi:hypothetical protein